MSTTPKLTDISTRPGKFQGEPIYIQALWETLHEYEDETIYDGDTPVSVILLDSIMREAYELAASDYAILLHETEYGFVTSWIVSKAKLDSFRTACESDTNTEDK